MTRRSRRLRIVGIAIFTTVFAVLLTWLEVYAFREGWRLQRSDPRIKLGAGPFVGSWDWRWSLKLVPAITIAAIAAVGLPVLAGRVRARISVAGTAVTAAVFAWGLAASDGWSTVIAPVTDRTEYWLGARTALPAGEYLRTYIDRQASYSVHVRGHPPGFSLLLIGMRRAGLGTAWAAAALSYLGIAATVIAVAWTVHRLAGRRAMVHALPFLALAPYAVWQGTSADAFFCGAAAVGVALLVGAMTVTGWRAQTSRAFAGGAVLGGCCMLTFGAPTLAPLVVGALLLARRTRWIPAALAGVAAVFALFAALGYWWLDGLSATRRFYTIGTAQFRGAKFFFFANLAVLAVALGPAVLAGLTRLRRTRLTVIALGGLACALLADASGLSKGETERIWLIYMPWIAVAAGALSTTRRRAQLWLGLQAASAVVLQAALVSKW